MIDGHKLILHLNDWWYSSFGYEETEESKAIKKVIDEVEKYVEHTADRKTEPSNSEIPNNCKTEPRKKQNFCGKCRYLYRDFKYGLSCYRLMDNEPCKYEERKDEPTISKMEQVDKDINVRSKTEPKTQTKTQNSNLTFEKADEPQIYVINPQEPTNDDKCFECDDFFTCGGQCNKIEDEPQTDCDHKCIQTEIGCEKPDCPWK